MKIAYRDLTPYKYSLLELYTHHTNLRPEKSVVSRMGYAKLNRQGVLTLKKGYAWDGPSGPAIDSKDFMRGSLVHDAIYQLMREKLLPQRMRKQADEILWMICLEDGMPKMRANYVYHAVRAFGASTARPLEEPRQVRITAP